MPSKKGTKFRTLHKFGKRRRNKSCVVRNEHDANTSIGGSDENGPHEVEQATSSSRKLEFFESGKQKMQTGRNEKSSVKRRKLEDNCVGDLDTPVSDDKSMNIIVNMGCLKSLVSNLACPSCHKKVCIMSVFIFD